MNNFFRLATALLLGLLLFSKPLSAAPAPGAPIFPFKDLQKGMKGVGYTTFSGIEPEPFDVEIIGFNYNMMGAGQHIIIALLTGPKIEFTSTISGMSGSPVYIDGKLVGAVSLALSKFPKEVLVGITPMESMIKAGNSYGGKLAVTAAEQGDNLAITAATPIPLVKTAPVLTKSNNKNFLLDSKERTKEFTKLIPGGPIAAFMVQGDVDLAGIGTITDIRDGVVYAFGHSFNNDGHVEVPFASAEIVWVVANQQLSYKMGNPGPVLGTIYEDRSTAIVGKIGILPEMIPVTIHFERPEGAEDYHFSIIRDKQNSSSYLTEAIGNILTSQIDYNRGGTLRYESVIKIKGKEPLKFVDYVSMDRNKKFLGMVFTPYVLAANGGGANFESLWNPPKGAVAVESLEFTYKYSPEDITLDFRSAEASQYKVKAGESIRIFLTFWNKEGTVMKKEIMVKIPLDTPAGKVKVVVGDAAKAMKNSGSVNFTTIEDFYRYMSKIRQDGYLYTQLLSAGTSMDIGTNKYHNMPPTFAMLATGENVDRRNDTAILWEGREPFDYVIKGSAEITLMVY